MTESTSVRKPVTDGNHAPIGQAQKDSSSDNSQEIPVPMDNVRPEGDEYQSVISPCEEYLRSNIHMRRSECIRKYPHRYDPEFGLLGSGIITLVKV